MFHVKLRGRATTVVAIVAALGLIGTGTATARSLITGADVKNGSITGTDIKDQSITSADLSKSTIQGLRGKVGLKGATGAKGATGLAGATGAKGDTGLSGTSGSKGDTGSAGAAGKDANYVGANWGVVHRNVMGNGDADLSSSTQTPPLGVGALNLRTGSAADKAAFGNEKDFAGNLLSNLTQVGFSVFTTGENNGLGNNMPAITLEIDPNTTTNASNFSSLVYVPNNGDSNKWTAFDADADTANHWGLTGSQFAGSQCSLNLTRCTLTEVQALLPDATIYSISVGKGRDYMFSGAVDALVINTRTFDFEPFGVFAK